MTERLPTIGETIELGVSDPETGGEETGTVIALMGLCQRRADNVLGPWSAAVAIDRGDTFGETRYLVGWVYSAKAYIGDMNAFARRAEALRTVYDRWQQVVDTVDNAEV